MGILRSSGLVVLLACAFVMGCGASSSKSNPDTETETGALPSLPVMVENWASVGVFSPASICGECHTASPEGISPAAMRSPSPPTAGTPSSEGEDISPMHGWRHSAMAHAFSDPYFRAKMKHETELFPHLASFIEDKCLSCHSPMARTHAHQTGISLAADASCILQDGCYLADSAINDAHAREGVSCTACHQITAKQAESGEYEISDSAKVIFGQYESPVATPMINRSGYIPQYGEHITESSHCANCHNLYTPTLDVGSNTPTGEMFPEQLPFTEWQHSIYAQDGAGERHCQDCHMGKMAEDFITRIAIQPNGSVNTNWPERPSFFSHDLVGGNAWILDLMEQFRNELGLQAVTEEGGFSRKAELTRQLLSAAATLEASNVDLTDGVLGFDITIQNHSGHKLPTGYPSRRIWLAVHITDGNGATLFESGIPDADHRLTVDQVFAGADCTAIQKPDGFDSSACFMPHITQVNSAAQVPIYEAVVAATDASITQVLLYASDTLKDNRIPPRGFDNDNVPEEIAPIGTDADGDFNVSGSGADTVSYLLDLSATDPASVHIDVALYYQAVRPSFITGLTGEHEWINQFRSAAALTPPSADIISTLSVTAP
ncbi:hypothetical protein [Alcanivorax sp. 1008]|uniref:hypothetical protein n=1 Tax=Alcanivorax sp. 1008 TaxID=2816853 RepID=UPI001DD66104|nr:hypothetical protein [Alcanivorax sp. 1008]MCC1496242.1 hypothetical protein [Alcanivorax sp. 1008]